MSLFDIVILLIIVLFAIRGFAAGMVSQIISIGSYILSWIISTRLSFLVAPSIPAEPPWNNIGAIIILFVITMIAIRFAHALIKKLMEKFSLVKYDRVLGLLLGFTKGLFICMVITFFAAMLCEKSRQLVLVSKSGQLISQLIVRVGCFIPEESGKILKTQIDLFNEQVDGKFQEPNNTDLHLPTVSLDAVFDNVQDIRNKIEDNIDRSKKAVSLVDGINRWWSEWWNGNDTDSETELTITPPTAAANNILNDVKSILNDAESEKQIWTQTSAPQLEQVLSSVQGITDEVVNQVSPESDSEQILIPRNRGLFRLSRTPVQPAKLNHSQNTTNNQPAKLFGQ